MIFTPTQCNTLLVKNNKISMFAGKDEPQKIIGRTIVDEQTIDDTQPVDFAIDKAIDLEEISETDSDNLSTDKDCENMMEGDEADLVISRAQQTQDKPRTKQKNPWKGSQLPPLDAFWSPATLQAKSNRKKMEEWLDLMGYNPEGVYFRSQTVAQLYTTISGLMQENVERIAEDRAAIFEANYGMYLEGPNSKVDSGDEHANNQLTKQSKAAPNVSIESEGPKEAQSSDLDMKDTVQEEELLEGSATAVQQDLALIRKAVIDSLQLKADNLIARKNGEDQYPKRYNDYLDSNPQILLKNGSGSPLLSIKVQLSVDTVIHSRMELLSIMKDEVEGRKHGKSFKRSLAAFTKNCREIHKLLEKAIGTGSSAKEAARIMVNEMFTSGIPGGAI